MILIPVTDPRTERLNTFITELRERYYYAQYQQEHEELISFLTDDSAPEPVLTNVWWFGNLFTVLNERVENWDTFDEWLMRFATRSGNWSNPVSYYGLNYSFYTSWLSLRIHEDADRSFLETITKKLWNYGVTNEEIVGGICNSGSYNYLTDNNKLTGIGEYVLARVSMSFLGFKKTSSLFPVIFQHSPSVPLLKLLLLYEPTIADKHLSDFLQFFQD